jgi:hypothetical protein
MSREECRTRAEKELQKALEANCEKTRRAHSLRAGYLLNKAFGGKPPSPGEAPY